MLPYHQIALFEARQLIELNHEIEKVKRLQFYSQTQHLKVVKELHETILALKNTTHYPLKATMDEEDSSYDISAKNDDPVAFSESLQNSPQSQWVRLKIMRKRAL
jgi:hypothetical protein